MIARLLAVAAAVAAAGLGLALVLWTGRREHWPWRPEHFFLLLLGLLALRVLIAPRPVPALRPRRVVAVGVAVYALLFSFVTVTRHFTFATHALDLGYYVQLGWNLARGAGPYVSLPEMHAWGDHLSPIMYAFVPAFWIAPGPVVLLVAQSAALALGGAAVLRRPRPASATSGPPRPSRCSTWPTCRCRGINVRDFHTAALAIPPLLAAAWAVEAGRPWSDRPRRADPSCREDAALPGDRAGGLMALARRRWAPGAIAAGGRAGGARDRRALHRARVSRRAVRPPWRYAYSATRSGRS